MRLPAAAATLRHLIKFGRLGRQVQRHPSINSDNCNVFTPPMGTTTTVRVLSIGSTGGSTGSTSVNSESNKEQPKFPDPSNAFENPLASLSTEVSNQGQGRFNVWQGEKRGPEIRTYERKVDENGVAYAKGGRKRSFARVQLFEGNGRVTVNGKSWIDYFPSVAQRDKILRPMMLLGVVGRFDLNCSVNGGGHTGQAEAIRFSVARALQNWHPQWRPILKKEGLLTRDSRIVEPKKYGRKKARKSFQWVKR